LSKEEVKKVVLPLIDQKIPQVDATGLPQQKSCNINQILQNSKNHCTEFRSRRLPTQ